MALRPIYKLTKGLKNRDFFILDFLILLLTPWLSLFIRYDGRINLPGYEYPLIITTALFLVTKLSIFYYLGLYKRLWHAASIDDLAKLIFIGFNSIILQIIVFWIFRHIEPLKVYMIPRSIPFIDGLLSIILVSALRFSIRFFERAYQIVNEDHNFKRIIIVGAGHAGLAVLQEIQHNSKLEMHPIGFIDDDKNKLKLKVRGIPVLGNRNDIPEIVSYHQIEQIVIAIPSVSGKAIKDILEICNNTGAEILTIPSLLDIIDGRISIKKMRKIQIEDLLRREPIQTDIQTIFNSIKSKVVLITGAGGSIGSEICRQVIRANPSNLILLGHGENSIFEIEEELKYLKTYNEITQIHSVICDIRSLDRLEKVFSEFNPDIVFHAAAHKHVPLMELNPQEAITNNVFGTLNCINMSVKYNTERFIMISTDKAVNPTNIMGATKRICEMIVLDAAKRYNKSFSVVRFGNVLGSRGSVVNTFSKQIQRGGPITVTHPKIIRYFMTIPEAVQLVLQAFILGKGGEIFVFDMGEPHLIDDLAKDMIKLSGLVPGKDIEIKYSGLRPGEKLFEELFNKGEVYNNTQHKKIYIAQNASSIVVEDLNEKLTQLSKVTNINDKKDITNLIKIIVKEYDESGYLNQLSEVIPENKS